MSAKLLPCLKQLSHQGLTYHKNTSSIHCQNTLLQVGCLSKPRLPASHSTSMTSTKCGNYTCETCHAALLQKCHKQATPSPTGPTPPVKLASWELYFMGWYYQHVLKQCQAGKLKASVAQHQRMIDYSHRSKSSRDTSAEKHMSYLYLEALWQTTNAYQAGAHTLSRKKLRRMALYTGQRIEGGAYTPL